MLNRFSEFSCKSVNRRMIWKNCRVLQHKKQHICLIWRWRSKSLLSLFVSSSFVLTFAQCSLVLCWLRSKKKHFCTLSELLDKRVCVNENDVVLLGEILFATSFLKFLLVYRIQKKNALRSHSFSYACTQNEGQRAGE